MGKVKAYRSWKRKTTPSVCGVKRAEELLDVCNHEVKTLDFIQPKCFPSVMMWYKIHLEMVSIYPKALRNYTPATAVFPLSIVKAKVSTQNVKTHVQLIALLLSLLFAIFSRMYHSDPVRSSSAGRIEWQVTRATQYSIQPSPFWKREKTEGGKTNYSGSPPQVWILTDCISKRTRRRRI